MIFNNSFHKKKEKALWICVAIKIDIQLYTVAYKPVLVLLFRELSKPITIKSIEYKNSTMSEI